MDVHNATISDARYRAAQERYMHARMEADAALNSAKAATMMTRAEAARAAAGDIKPKANHDDVAAWQAAREKERNLADATLELESAHEAFNLAWAVEDAKREVANGAIAAVAPLV